MHLLGFAPYDVKQWLQKNNTCHHYGRVAVRRVCVRLSMLGMSLLPGVVPAREPSDNIFV